MPMADARTLAAIFAGGFVGAIGRAQLGVALPYEPGQWPWATLIVNVAGAFVLGYVATRVQRGRPLFALSAPLLGTGFCGALTTFATLQLELLEMLDDGRAGLAGAYALTSVAAGLAAVALATSLVRRGRPAA